MQEFHLVSPALELILQVLEIMGGSDKVDQLTQNEGTLRNSINEFNDYFIEMLDFVMEQEQAGNLSADSLANFQTCCKIICEL